MRYHCFLLFSIIFHFFFPAIKSAISDSERSDTVFSEYDASKELSDDIFLKKKLKEYRLDVPSNLFNYGHITEVHSSILDESFPLDEKIEKIAKDKYLRLNSSPFFNMNFITQPEKVRSFQLKPKVFKADVGKLVNFTTSDGVTICGTYFDRESDTLIVVGPGFTNEREKMSPFIHIFAECDLILFDYRGHGYQKTLLTDHETWNFNIFSYLFGVNPKEARLGLDEEKDVYAVVDGMKERKNYTKVLGLGICYSAMIFAKVASLRKDLFTHLVLDGCWFSLEVFCQRISRDLKMLITPQRGGWQNFWFTRQEWGRDFLLKYGESLFNINFKSISILDYIPYLSPNLPVLYFYGKDDKVISRQEFEIMWKATPSLKKTAIITSNPHVWNHLKQKELYTLIVKDLFLNLSHEDFISCLQNPNLLQNPNQIMINLNLSNNNFTNFSQNLSLIQDHNQTTAG